MTLPPSTENPNTTRGLPPGAQTAPASATTGGPAGPPGRGRRRCVPPPACQDLRLRPHSGRGAVGAEDDVGIQQGEQRGKVSSPGGRQEGVHNFPLAVAGVRDDAIWVQARRVFPAALA